MRIMLMEDDVGLGPAVRDQIAADGHVFDRVYSLANTGSCHPMIDYDLMPPHGMGVTRPKDMTTLDRIDGPNADAAATSNTIKVYVSRLRKNPGRDSVETLRGLGYRVAR